jgi:hypothetical protein
VVTTLPGGDGRNLWPGAEDYQQVSVLGAARYVPLRASPSTVLALTHDAQPVEAYDAIDLVVVRGKVVDRSVLAAR